MPLLDLRPTDFTFFSVFTVPVPSFGFDGIFLRQATFFVGVRFLFSLVLTAFEGGSGAGCAAVKTVFFDSFVFLASLEQEMRQYFFEVE